MRVHVIKLSPPLAQPSSPSPSCLSLSACCLQGLCCCNISSVILSDVLTAISMSPADAPAFRRPGPFRIEHSRSSTCVPTRSPPSTAARPTATRPTAIRPTVPRPTAIRPTVPRPTMTRPTANLPVRVILRDASHAVAMICIAYVLVI
ncbi:unnamed protein product [Chondrus crispus]|uniref:Uncharacterized protein n=1 Tax=Chondrus crispus TaxID=2769 RepID=R7Q751_CHOCR|nr:unnamed protein product [Chondrus crispus]CDF34357.1 unnamed protein product [Chondrus crispus]|eukprot:XP_005714176.1 unnamed protein product [Chondrus crispus]